MDTLGCGVCKSPGQNRPATPEEAKQFWLAKGMDGAAPPGMEVHSVIRCAKEINLPRRNSCECETAWVRDSAAEAWRPIVRLPHDFVASVVA